MEAQVQSTCICGGLLKSCSKPATRRLRHDGLLHEVSVEKLPYLLCERCGEEFFTAEADDLLRRQLRSQLKFLQPDEIRSLRERAGLTQEALGDCTKIAPETISRWENGRVIQSAASDNHLRLFFDNLARIRSESSCEVHLSPDAEEATQVLMVDLWGSDTWLSSVIEQDGLNRSSPGALANAQFALAA